MIWKKYALLLLSGGWLLLQQACIDNPPAPVKMFSEMPATFTGIDFKNTLEFRQDFNIYTYRNFYNGGGVAIGDVNNDGLPDVYFTGNMVPNRLYLNRGNWKFEDVTSSAGVAGRHAWSTGVAMADVNGDGWLDIYVCNSGDVEGDGRQNELFINKGIAEGNNDDIPVFDEKANEYGLADQGLSTHAAFFDYDKDGDLDLYLLNNSFRAIGSFDFEVNERLERDSVGGDKLFRNDGNIFTDVSEEAGIYGSIVGFGLGVTVGDVDLDGWQDIYVSNDFFERDYLYINQHDGTFHEELPHQMASISAASMGADCADVNGDGWPEIFVTEMLPQDEDRIKTKTTFDNWNRLQLSIKSDYYRQFTRNMLQRNNGDGTFSEIGRLAGVEATDWSWGALIQDFNNDGLKDIFVANGIFQDLTDQDFLQFIAADETKKAVISREGVDFRKLVEFIPSEPVPNYLFENTGHWNPSDTSLQPPFVNRAAEWGIATPGFSNGSAYADLDNDGDLDLVVNNLNSPPFVYRNNAETLLPRHNWLQLQLMGDSPNTFGVGAKVYAWAGTQFFYVEHNPIRGFESSMDYRVHLGLGTTQMIDSLVVLWYSGKMTRLEQVPARQLLTLKERDAIAGGETYLNRLKNRHPSGKPLLQPLAAHSLAQWSHRENLFVDFDRDRLLYHMISTEGPKIAAGDVNGDGLTDVFFGNAKDSPAALFIQRPGGHFRLSNQPLWEKDAGSEDLGSTFFDADGDGDLDLYVASGGNEFSAGNFALKDRLYFNDGKGHFTDSKSVQPGGKLESSSCVKAADFDDDGDLDLFVGVRVLPFYYGVPPNSYLLQNDGKGNFTDVTDQLAPSLRKAGMVTDAVWLDADRDGDLDLALAGEWMPVKLLKNEKGMLQETHYPALDQTSGWWNCLEAADVDNDGDLDLIAGGHGRNSRFRASISKPISCYINDFDQNGSVEQIICQYNGDKSYPLVLRHDLISQMTQMKKKYLKYESYKGQTIEDMFTPEQLKNSIVHKVVRLQSSLLINDGSGKFQVQNLPLEAQLSPVYAILPHDFDGDGNLDLLLGGNLLNVKPEMGQYDASFGCYLKGNGDGSFSWLPPSRSGIKIQGEIRDFATIQSGTKTLLIVARNNDTPVVLQQQGH